MSYTRQYSETIRVTGSVSGSQSCSNPNCSHSISYSKNYSQNVPVKVNIKVDTREFDSSVDHCNHTVDGLTGTVVATEAAEIISKRNNSLRIGDTVIKGFFNVIGTELHLQVQELARRGDALQIELKELASSCFKKQGQMETDFNRISARYQKIFEDLNQELENRVYEVDKPTFLLEKHITANNARVVNTDLVNTVTIGGMENGELQSHILSSTIRRRAVDTINRLKIILLQQKSLEHTINRRIFNSNQETSISLPVCFMQWTEEGGALHQEVYTSDCVPMLSKVESKKRLNNQFESVSDWTKLSAHDSDRIQSYLDNEIENSVVDDTPYSRRVISTLRGFSNLNQITSINQ